MIHLIPKEGISNCIEQFIDVPVPQITVGAVKHVPQERVQNYTVEQLVDVIIPRIRRETERVIQLAPQDRISDRVVEQSVDVSVSQAKVPAIQIAQRTVGVM